MKRTEVSARSSSESQRKTKRQKQQVEKLSAAKSMSASRPFARKASEVSSMGDRPSSAATKAPASAKETATSGLEQPWDWEAIIVRNNDAHHIGEVRALLDKADLEEYPLLTFDWKDRGALLAVMQAAAAAVPPVLPPPYLQAFLPALNVATDRRIHRGLLEFLRAVPGDATRRFGSAMISCTGGQSDLIVYRAGALCGDPYFTAIGGIPPAFAPLAKILKPTPRLTNADDVSPQPFIPRHVQLWG